MTERVHIRGRVERRVYAAGSKSERPAMTIVTPGGDRLMLRRVGANPYTDDDLEALDGALIEATGRIHRDVFLLDDYRVVTE